jgi:DNA-binding transcriptional ArsR family regulator
MELSISDIRTIMVGWRDALSAAILALDPLLGEPMPAALAAPLLPPKKPRAIPPERPAARPRADAESDIGASILAALRKKSPQSPGELSKAVNVSVANLRYRLKALEHNGAITSSGTTSGRRIALVSGGKAAKEAP